MCILDSNSNVLEKTAYKNRQGLLAGFSIAFYVLVHNWLNSIFVEPLNVFWYQSVNLSKIRTIRLQGTGSCTQMHLLGAICYVWAGFQSMSYMSNQRAEKNKFTIIGLWQIHVYGLSCDQKIYSYMNISSHDDQWRIIYEFIFEHLTQHTFTFWHSVWQMLPEIIDIILIHLYYLMIFYSIISWQSQSGILKWLEVFSCRDHTKIQNA